MDLIQAVRRDGHGHCSSDAEPETTTCSSLTSGAPGTAQNRTTASTTVIPSGGIINSTSPATTSTPPTLSPIPTTIITRDGHRTPQVTGTSQFIGRRRFPITTSRTIPASSGSTKETTRQTTQVSHIPGTNGGFNIGSTPSASASITPSSCASRSTIVNVTSTASPSNGGVIITSRK